MSSPVLTAEVETTQPEQIALSLKDASAAEIAATVRGLLEDKRLPAAISVAAALDGGHGALAAGIIAARRGFDALAWRLLKDQPVAVWAVVTPSEYVRSGMVTDREATLAAVRELTEDVSDLVPAQSWLDLLGPMFAHREYALARALFQRLDAAVGYGAGVDRDVRWARDWLRDWVNRPVEPATVPRAEGAVASFAILDYKHPDRFRASANIGDHVQSLAALGHLVRQQELTFTGPAELTDLAGRLQQRVRPEVRRTELNGTVDLYLAQRDGSHQDAFPVDTWALGFGWYMHPQWDISCDFGFHPNLRPIFVSFHISRRQLLTPQAVDYLKQYAPIGCRDWTTVDLLLSAGVDAFFSGCMTTTVSNLFPDTDQRPPADAPWAYIDSRPPEDAHGYVRGHQRRLEVRTTPFERNVDIATDMLETWRSGYAGITTSRLHVYLPGRSIGARVDFRAKNASDPRFTGLAPLDDAGFDQIRSTINDRLERVLGRALSGAPVPEVYEEWRRLNADDVAAAKARLARPVQITEPRFAIQQVLDTAPALPARLDDNTIHVAVRATSRHPRLLQVLLSSIMEHTSRPVHVRIITRAPDAFSVADLEARFPGLRVSLGDTRPYGNKIVTPGGQHHAAEVDKFLTADLMPEVDRLIVLPIGSVVTADLAELADLDLQQRLLAAARPSGSTHTSGYTVLLSAAQRLKTETERSAEFRRIMHQRHDFDFARFSTEVLVIDAQQWRSGEHGRNLLAWAENFGLNYREALHAELGAASGALPDRWHRVPTQTPVDDAALVHWAEHPRPWNADPAPAAQVWENARAR